jgi:hypothetical protein
MGLPISEKSKLSAEPTRKSFLSKSTPFVRLRTERDVKALAARTISQVRSGQLHYKLAQTIASLCNVALQAMKQGNEVALRLGAGKDNNYRIRKIIELEAAPSGDGLDGNKRDPDQVGVGLKLDARGGK